MPPSSAARTSSAPAIGVDIGGTKIAAGAVGAITTGVLIVSVVVQMIFGELFPKNLAISNPEPLARALARSRMGRASSNPYFCIPTRSA